MLKGSEALKPQAPFFVGYHIQSMKLLTAHTATAAVPATMTAPTATGDTATPVTAAIPAAAPEPTAVKADSLIAAPARPVMNVPAVSLAVSLLSLV